MNDELVYGSEPTYRRSAVGWAVLIALGAGMVWGLASVWLNMKLAWLALGVAVVVAMAWRGAAYEPSRKTAVGSAALLLLAAAAAWGTGAMVGRQHISGSELKYDPGLLTSAVRDWMFTQGEIEDPLAEVETDHDADDTDTDDPDGPPALDEATEDEAEQVQPEDAPPPIRPEAQVRRRIAEMTDAQKREVMAWYVNQPGGQAARRKVAQRAWGLLDYAWIAAGAFLAFRLSCPPRDDEDEDE